MTDKMGFEGKFTASVATINPDESVPGSTMVGRVWHFRQDHGLLASSERREWLGRREELPQDSLGWGWFSRLRTLFWNPYFFKVLDRISLWSSVFKVCFTLTTIACKTSPTSNTWIALFSALTEITKSWSAVTIFLWLFRGLRATGVSLS